MNPKDLQQQFPYPEWPEFLDVKVSESQCTLTLYLQSGIRWFEGHFPEQPILAGVVQTHWAAELGKYLFDIQKDVMRIDNLKFQSVMLPEQRVDLLLDYVPDSHILKFSYRANELNFSEGRFVFQSQQIDSQHLKNEKVFDK